MSGGEIAVIGAGPGGLAAAMLLSGNGYDVTVYEKQRTIGGRTSRLQLGDYRFDLGPTFFMMPHLLEEIFQSVGRSLYDYVTMVELDPLYRLQFGDIDFRPTRKQEEMVERIEALFPGNGAGYRRFMREEEEKFRRIAPLLQRPFSKPWDYVARDVLAALPKLHATDHVYNRLSRYFADERLIYSFTFQAKYLGMSPWECPGTFTILSYLEHRYGLHHPIGGVNRICHAMARVIEEFGGVIHTSAPVDRVLIRNGTAYGVQLPDGDRREYDHVVINADFATAMNTLFRPGELKKFAPRKLAEKKYSCSTYMLYLGVNRKVNLPHHTILFADDYRSNVKNMMSEGVLSSDASVYVHNPGANDATLAPDGKSALYVLMPVPNLTGSIPWDEKEAEVRQSVLTRLERLPELAGLSGDIEAEAAVTPADWRDNYGVFQGATFNLAHSLDQMMMLRPHNRFDELRNCWLVGGGTHPGSGLPTIFESARISAGLLMKQDRRTASCWRDVLPLP
ncbi:phytoene desaturase family protein [Paenibacillus sp. J5C_2022]|uniref:phytoene desaturase family protein n=1 Tax=Paenibacillus sp. J5C2022 TaxID=2977129 RepID=UPI0021D09CF6|nr:phytoene desaturase family protein [Paenibacillus sp. J5C2022]MCU6709995.1 phytoene desaturase family protein [Paenibacillus sp. J5C2022]